jgi:hypothetical protein
LFLNEKQIEQVKDGITFGVVKVTYTATLDMIPSLKQEEKEQIYAWLVEARRAHRAISRRWHSAPVR